MRVTRDAHLPTHLLAVTFSGELPSAPVFVPIDMNLYMTSFRVELNAPAVPPGTTAPVPHTVEGSLTPVVTLPVIPLQIPHVASLPLLFLFAFNFEKDHNELAFRVLPPHVVEEFPNAAAMAQIFSRLREDYFERYYRFNQGLWKNILALGLKDQKIVELVQIAWNVTAETRRLRQRSRQQ